MAMRRRFLRRRPLSPIPSVRPTRSTRPLRKGLIGAFVALLACTGDLRFAGDAGTIPDQNEPDATVRDAAGGPGSDAAGGGGADGGGSDAGGSDGGGGLPRCTIDPDCKVPGLHCDVVSHTCVECANNAHCSGDAGWPLCDISIHRCVVCQAPTDCPSGMTCESATRSCVFTCSAGTSCPGNRRCDSSRGICIECASKSECPLPDRNSCETATGTCTACAADGDCPSGRAHCDRTRGLCGECLSQSDCASGSVCDFRTNTFFVVP